MCAEPTRYDDGLTPCHNIIYTCIDALRKFNEYDNLCSDHVCSVTLRCLIMRKIQLDVIFFVRIAEFMFESSKIKLENRC